MKRKGLILASMIVVLVLLGACTQTSTVAQWDNAIWGTSTWQ
jgi:hypothetical protein